MVYFFKNLKFLNFIFFTFSLLFFPKITQGALLYFQPSGGVYFSQETIVFEIKLDTQGECINVVKGEIKYPRELLEFLDFSVGESILKIWLQFPKVDSQEGIISFIGGIPGGYCGFPLDSENSLLKIAFYTKKVEKEEIAKLEFLDTSRIYLNDGMGNLAKTNFESATFKILEKEIFSGKDFWEKELLKDKIPPERFNIEIRQDPLLFEGKYLIVFFTTDKQSGIDHYEVKEGNFRWEKAESPYLLKDQSLKSEIKVKAVDKAGNERVEKIKPKKNSKIFLFSLLFLPFFGLIFLKKLGKFFKR